jgi:putative ABC transport system permease protein
MLEQLRFYAAHSWNDLRSNPQRTAFALLCIAAGVAAIVSLQTLAAMVQNTLTANLQQSNRGDLQIRPANSNNEDGEAALEAGVEAGLLMTNDLTFGGFGTTQYFFSAAGYDQLREWLQATYPGTAVTYRVNVASPIALFTGSGQGVAITHPQTGQEARGVFPVVIEAARYPFYGDIASLEGVPLAQLLTSPDDILLSAIVAEQIDAAVGDIVTLQGIDGTFTVRGIVPTDAEVRNPTQDFLAALNGFYMLDVAALTRFNQAAPRIDPIYVRLPQGTDVVAVERALGQRFPFTRATTTEDLRRTYERVSENVNQLVTVMGLIALLLGCVGIINTMQVVVRRRVLEIAVLKTLGLQSNQITALFLFEAAVMGALGSAFGVVLGWGLVFAIRGVAESLLGQPLAFIVAPNAVIAGVVVGTLVTTVFGFIPTLSAGKVRPAAVLRPEETLIPRSGRLSTLGALLIVMAALSAVAAGILGSALQAVAVIVGAFIVAGVLFALLTLTIWLIARFLPSFGVVDLKIALREMLVTRGRAAVTLLALVVGVFSLSLITLLADAVTQSISQLLEQEDNVFIQVPNRTALQRVETELAALAGDVQYSINFAYRLNFVEVARADGSTLTLDQIQARLIATDPFLAFRATPAPGEEVSLDRQRQLRAQELRRRNEFVQIIGGLGALTPEQLAAQPDVAFLSGRQLTPADANGLVLTESSLITDAGLQVGDTIVYTYSVGGFLGIGARTETLRFTIVGIRPQPTDFALGQPTNYVLMSSLPDDLAPNSIGIAASIPPDQIAPLRRAIADIPQTFLIETEVFVRLFEALLGQFTSFPLLVALLGLVVGGVVIANSVALSTLERRREIAVMKSIGLQRERVLGMLLIENAILGLVGGIVGIGLGLVGLMVLLQGQIDAPINWPTVLLLMALCVGVALSAALTTAWGASGEKPLNVLRYE